MSSLSDEPYLGLFSTSAEFTKSLVDEQLELVLSQVIHGFCTGYLQLVHRLYTVLQILLAATHPNLKTT